MLKITVPFLGESGHHIQSPNQKHVLYLWFRALSFTTTNSVSSAWHGRRLDVLLPLPVLSTVALPPQLMLQPCHEDSALIVLFQVSDLYPSSI